MDAKDPPVSAEELDVFKTYVDIINAERATMWARHNALLVANSLILSALAISTTHKWANIALLAAGLLISGAWWIITVKGWSAVHHHAAIAGTFAGAYFDRLPNPFSAGVYGRAQTTIYRLILAVIAVFILMYFGLGYARLVAL